MDRQPFQVVLLDSELAPLDGVAAVPRILGKLDAGSTLVAMVNSAGHRGDAPACEGATNQLAKPTLPSELRRALLKVLTPARGGEPSESSAGTETVPSRSWNILLAEDNPVNQRLVLRILEKHGCSVTVASDGREALQRLEEQDFDVVLMDVQMPQMDGFEATSQIRGKERRTGRHIPIIALTAHAMPRDRELCLQAGMDEYIAKPIHSKELVERLDHLLS